MDLSNTGLIDNNGKTISAYKMIAENSFQILSKNGILGGTIQNSLNLSIRGSMMAN